MVVLTLDDITVFCGNTDLCLQVSTSAPNNHDQNYIWPVKKREMESIISVCIIMMPNQAVSFTSTLNSTSESESTCSKSVLPVSGQSIA